MVLRYAYRYKWLAWGLLLIPLLLVLAVQASADEVPGDLNGDGAVDGSDLTIVSDALGTSPPSDERADADGDGRVGVQDLAYVGQLSVTVLPRQDGDGDGVPDDSDDCPDTPTDSPVDGDGCPTEPPEPVPQSECNVTVQKSFEGPQSVSWGIRDEEGQPTGEFEEVLTETEIITIVSSCTDPRAGGHGPNVHVETFVIECVKEADLKFADCRTRRLGPQ